MKWIKNLGNELKQQHTISTLDGLEFSLYVEYRVQELGWFMSLTWKNKTINNIRIVTSGNILHQWRGVLPFGLSCIVEADEEATLQNDFFSGRAKLLLLSRAEVASYTEVLSGQISA